MTLYIIKYNIKVRNLTLVQYCEADYRCHSLFRIFLYPFVCVCVYFCAVLSIQDTGVDVQMSMYRYGCITHTRYRRGYTDTHVQIWMYYPSQFQAWIYRYPSTDMDVLPIPDPAWIYRYPCTDMDVLPIPDPGVDIQIPMYRYGCITHPRSRCVPWPQRLSLCCLLVPTFCPYPLVNTGRSSNTTPRSFWECHINGNIVGNLLRFMHMF